MPIHRAADERLKRLFWEGFTVRDVAESLVSFDATTSVTEARKLIVRRDFDVVGVRRDGLVTGFLIGATARSGNCGDHLQSFTDEDVIADSESLAVAITRLNEHPQLFVSSLNSVEGIVTRGDFEKSPVRMWLFGMISIVEMRLVGLIAETLPDGVWREYVSAGRLAKAEQMFEERKRRNQYVDLLNCLQFSDKGQIVAKCDALRNQTRLESARHGKQLVKQLESLRNNLAHAQDIIGTNWQMIVELASNMDAVLFGPQDDTPTPR